MHTSTTSLVSRSNVNKFQFVLLHILCKVRVELNYGRVRYKLNY